MDFVDSSSSCEWLRDISTKSERSYMCKTSSSFIESVVDVRVLDV